MKIITALCAFFWTISVLFIVYDMMTGQLPILSLFVDAPSHAMRVISRLAVEAVTAAFFFILWLRQT